MRTKFVVFAVLATLFSTLIMTVMLYGRTKRALTDRLGNELAGLSSEAAREMGAWIDQRVYDLRLRAAPYVVSDNLARAAGRGGPQALNRLHDYVGSIRQNLPGHEGLAILDTDGQVLTSSGSRTGFRLSTDRLNNLRTRDALVGDAFWDASINKAAIVVVVPIRRDDGLFLGALAAKINLDGVRDTLKELSGESPRNISIITEQGRVVISSTGNPADVMKAGLPDAAIRDLTEREGQTVEQSRAPGKDVVAVLRRIPQLRWAAVAEAPSTETARERSALRAETFLLLIPLLLGISVLAFVVAVMLTRPLERLTEAAGRVAAGDLSAEFPAGSSGEVGYLTRALNTVVARLREKESQGELEKLSLTDALTGLYNRRHLMGTLASEVQRARRQRRPFTVLLADVDKFKQYNDTHGHLAGDAALVKVAEVFRRTTRAVDCVARYGGEEFVVMLLECPVATAALVAERIRARVADQDLGQGKLTVSIGLAEYPDGGDTPEELIATADAAMYQAKSSGRDQVVVAGALQQRPPEKKPRRKKEVG
ncbi:MAG TPA: diguanylate cyclase [Gemmatimonadales bacterium]|nr:diguanylate cyclase [Gemmatimonadales bacterium]